jgi:hypothetical protein
MEVNMSRSYRKFPSGPYCSHDSDDFYDSQLWRKFRNLERNGLKKEMCASVNGEEVFPRYRQKRYRNCYPLKDIRDVYFKNIRNILNGYTSHSSDGTLEDDTQSEFLQHYNTIKNGEKPYTERQVSSFEWLYDKDVRAVIKGWQGTALDVLYYLTKHRFIEKAAIRKHRKEDVSK